MMLGEAQDQWRNRVEDKDASQFTVAGKMVQMRYSPQSSPVISRKKYSPKPVQGRSKTSKLFKMISVVLVHFLNAMIHKMYLFFYFLTNYSFKHFFFKITFTLTAGKNFMSIISIFYVC